MEGDFRRAGVTVIGIVLFESILGSPRPIGEITGLNGDGLYSPQTIFSYSIYFLPGPIVAGYLGSSNLMFSSLYGIATAFLGAFVVFLIGVLGFIGMSEPINAVVGIFLLLVLLTPIVLIAGTVGGVIGGLVKRLERNTAE